MNDKLEDVLFAILGIIFVLIVIISISFWLLALINPHIVTVIANYLHIPTWLVWYKIL